MSEPSLKEKAAVLRCIPYMHPAANSDRPSRVQRFQLVHRLDATHYEWISQHRFPDTARAAALELKALLRDEVRIFDVQAAEFLEPGAERCAG